MLQLSLQKVKKKKQRKKPKGKVNPKYLFNYSEKLEGFVQNLKTWAWAPHLNHCQLGSYCEILFSILWTC